jgi:hypothetical protein
MGVPRRRGVTGRLTGAAREQIVTIYIGAKPAGTRLFSNEGATKLDG